jgi:tetratricopeptide (TPR) repeat protein
MMDLHDNGTEPFAEVAGLGGHLLFQAHLAEGNLEDARQTLASLERLKTEQGSEYGFLYEDALGRLACDEGHTDAALGHFAQAQATVSFTGTQTGVVVLFHKLLLDAQLECLEKAGAYETLLQRAGEVPIFVYHFHDYNTSTMGVRLRTILRKAHAYEALGQIPQALAAYEEFLTFWQDPVLPGVREAQTRLAALKN